MYICGRTIEVDIGEPEFIADETYTFDATGPVYAEPLACTYTITLDMARFGERLYAAFEPPRRFGIQLARRHRQDRGPGIRRRPKESGLDWLTRVDRQVRARPEPLPVDGREYRRRQRARRRNR